MSKIHFSVLLSVYSKEQGHFFDAALDSILIHQTRKPDELVLICDGPLTEELDAVVEKYTVLFPDIVKVYRLETNQGLGAALNYGLSKSSYEWIARADSDDICVENRFETQIAYLQEHPEIDIVSGYIEEFRENPQTPERLKTLPTQHSDIAKMAKKRNPINHMAVMFRKAAIMDAGSYLPLPYVEDYYLWVRAIAHGAKLANIGQILVHVRIGNGMEARRGNTQQIAGWYVINCFMLQHCMVNYFSFFVNMISICIFVYTPAKFKSLLYKFFLRRSI